jgi:hypothetical protein
MRLPGCEPLTGVTLAVVSKNGCSGIHSVVLGDLAGTFCREPWITDGEGMKLGAISPSHDPMNRTAWPKENGARGKRPYRKPEVVVVGRASDLVMSYSYGKYSDGYTGYYWER